MINILCFGILSAELPSSREGRVRMTETQQFLITPIKNIDRAEMMSEFSRALMATSTGSDTMYVNLYNLKVF